VVDTMLYDSPDLVIHRTEIWVGRKEVWRLDATVQFLHERGAMCWCTVLLEHVVIHHQALCVSLAAQYEEISSEFPAS